MIQAIEPLGSRLEAEGTGTAISEGTGTAISGQQVLGQPLVEIDNVNCIR